MAAEESPAPLGILAGGGELPFLLVQASRASGREPFVIAFNGFTEQRVVAGTRHAWVDLAKVGQTMRHLHEAGCRAVVFAGGMRRPSLSSLIPDLRGAAVLAKIARAGGDDAVLRVLVAEMEAEGFRVLGADDILGDLIARAGSMGTHAPALDAWSDIRRGAAVVRALGAVDVGQAAVVQQGIVLGVEAAEGTDALLARCGALRREGRGGVLVKLKKPGQERRTDLPMIGAATVINAAAAGLVGVAVEAGEALVMGRAQVAAEADARGLFVYGLTAAELA